LSELFQDQKRFWWVVVIWTGISTGTYGVILWGRPSCPASEDHAHEAAGYFVYASIASFLGRILFSVLPLYTGRRGAGADRNLGLGAGDAEHCHVPSPVHRRLVGVRAAGDLWRGILQRLVLQHVALCRGGVSGFTRRPGVWPCAAANGVGKILARCVWR